MLRKLAPALLCSLPLACGAGGAVTPAASPSSVALPEKSDESRAEPSRVTGLGELPDGISPAPSQCQSYAGDAAGSSCRGGDAIELLAAALEESADNRDASLRCLESAPTLPPGLMRALRADLAPRECGDAVVGDANASGAPRDVADALVALGVGARLYRTVRNAPLPAAGSDKAAFLLHFKERLRPWIVTQAHAIDVLSKVGPRLNGYGKAVVALEAGLADMRFVHVARSVQLPEEMKNDPEIRETYLVALEQALEPRITRGRDAALVGLGELARLGVLKDARLAEARALLSTLFAGRRIDALDGLRLMPLPPLEVNAPSLKVAAKLPAFYAMKLATSPNVDDPKLLRARLEQGVPPGLWLDGTATKGGAELGALSQRALFMLGQTYFWAEPFSRVANFRAPAADTASMLVAALAKVLAKGPRNAAAMMLGPTTLPAELRDTSPLDELTKAKGPVAGLAEFNAAYLRGLAPPANDPAFWKEQNARYQRAQQKLQDQDAKMAALELAKAALDTERELRQQPKP
jgi:hypothetical protein